MESKEKYIQSLQQDEELHSQIYHRLWHNEKSHEVRRTLLQLYKIERAHSSTLERLLRIDGFAVRKRNNSLHIFFILLSQKLLALHLR